MGANKQFWTWMFQAPANPRSAWSVVLWWEMRRIPYNLIVGSVGFVSLIIFSVCITTSGVLGPGEDAIEPLTILFAPFIIDVGYFACCSAHHLLLLCGVIH